jgi:hypothetical protein
MTKIPGTMLALSLHPNFKKQTPALIFRDSWRHVSVRVDDLEIGEIYRVSEDERERLDVVEVRFKDEDDKFLKFGHPNTIREPKDPTIVEIMQRGIISQLVLEPLVYIGTKRSRLNTHESVEAVHVFASTKGEHFCVLGRNIKYILPFTP